ncbi:unnamed protein product [Ectocarpus sp. CCAP 1310/34]|nr:unnamed protein product [Ectocarpus sp. CCAP 1310/34]
MAQDEPRVAQEREEKGAAERNPTTTAISTTARVAAVPISDSVVRSVVDMRDDSSARIWEIGYRSILRPEEGSGLPWRLGPQDQNSIVDQGGRSRVSNTFSDDAATRSHVNAPGTQEPWPLSAREGEETRESAGGQEGNRDRAEIPCERPVENEEDRMFRRAGPIPDLPANTVSTGRATGHMGSPSLPETFSEHNCCVNRRRDQDTLVLAQTPPAGHVARCADTDDNDYRDFHEHSEQPNTADGEGQHITSSTEKVDNAVESMTGDGIPRGQRELRPPSPPSSCCGSVVQSFSPPRHEDTSQGLGDRLVSSPYVSAVAMAESHTMSPEDHSSMGFVARQRFEQLAAERRREEWSRAREETRRKLAAGGWWVNCTSRAILARSSFSCAGGDKGNSHVTGGEGRGPSVFERLAHRAPYHEEDPVRDDFFDNEEYGRAAAVRADGHGARGHPFQPTINHRSSLLASRMPYRDKDKHGCPQQRLHREGEEWLSRREKRIQLADEEMQEKAAARHVNPESERVLARRSRSRMAWFRSAMMEAFDEVDANRTGWLSLAGVESLLSKCGMLPNQGPDDVRDDVLLAVWATLSEEETSEVGGHGSSDGGLDQDDLKPTFGVPADDLAVLLAEAARTCEYDRVDARPQMDGHESFPSAFAEELQQSKQIKDLCNELSGIFEVNQLHRASKRQDKRRVQTGETAGEERRACSQGISTELKPAGRRRDGEDVLLSAPPRVVTRGQVAAMAERFEEQIRERERKIEILRRSDEARTTTDHTFQPNMAATATPEALALRRKVARTAKGQGTGVPSRDRAISESRHPTKTDLRTSEERDVEENCTFQPRLFQPLPIPPPRYPVPSTPRVGGRSGGESTTDSAGEVTSNIASAITVDRATASWMAQVNRLKAGRKNRLRRLEEERATANRSEPLPPAVRQLFVDEGIQLGPTKDLSGRSSASANKRDGSTTSKGKDCNSARRTSNKVSSPSSWFRLQGRCRGRRRLKDKRREEQARKNAEDDAEQLKRKRVLSRACRRSAAVVGLEAALSAREAERECSGLDDPPVVIVELEFVRQKWWALLPFWADTCPKEAVGKLAEQQPRVVVEGVAQELEEFFRDEIDRAGACMTSVDRDQVAEQGALAGRDVGPGKNNRRHVPKVVLRVDVG